MLVLWAGRRLESLYGYFALALLCWALIMARYFVSDPPLPLKAWQMTLGTAEDASTLLLFLFAMRYAGLQWPRVERIVWSWAGIERVFMVLEMTGAEWVQAIAKAWGYSGIVVTLAWLAILGWGGWRRPAAERALVILAVVFVGATMIRDVVAGKIFGDLDFLFYPFSAIPICIAIGWVLAQRFVRSLNESESLNAELESRVAQKHAELEENYRRMNELEQQRAVAGERQRIMSDMHDGVGGQLIQTLALVEQGELTQAEVATALRECIDDLGL